MTMNTSPTADNRDYVTSTSAATTSTLTVVAADEAGLVGEVWGSADPTSRVAAMLRLSSLFPYTAATDLALAGYDVIGYTPVPAWLVTA